MSAHRICYRLGATVALLVLLAVSLPTSLQAGQDMRIRVGLILPVIESAGAPTLGAAVARSAEQGAILAQEEFAATAALFNVDFAVLIEEASGADVVAAAERTVRNGAFAVVGGFNTQEAMALSAWAAKTGILFFNVGAAANSLRNELCAATTFHVEPSAAMYLDALAGWYLRAGYRQWYFVLADTGEGRALYDRVRWSLQARHFGAREVGHTMVKPGSNAGASLAPAIRASGADSVFLLLDADEQLRVLGQLDAAGIAVPTTGFPYPETQTRAFLTASAKIAPRLGTGHRATSWEPTIDAYGAREFNSRFTLRWQEPMSSSAWGVFSAIKILYETVLFGNSVDTKEVSSALVNQASVFDLYKGIGVSFRPWDRQLRQSLYLIKITAQAASLEAVALLVGELPAIYLPGTDPTERLDQLGDLAPRSQCTK